METIGRQQMRSLSIMPPFWNYCVQQGRKAIVRNSRDARQRAMNTRNDDRKFYCTGFAGTDSIDRRAAAATARRYDVR
ncbi:unnamed protein product, partial [Iphiclides podalirius]